MAVISGISGAVEKSGAADIASVGAWSINLESGAPSHGASNTQGGTTTIPGNNDWSGSYEAFGHTPSILPNQSHGFYGSIDGVNGAHGQIRCSAVDIFIDIENGAPIVHTVEFGADGALTIEAETAADATIIEEPSSVGCKLELANVTAPSYAVVPDVRNIRIRIMADLKSFVTSNTSGETERAPGRLTYEITFSVYTSDFSTLPAPNDVQAIRIYVTQTEYWEFRWGLFTALSDMGANINDASLVEATLTAVMKGVAEVSGNPTVGFIKKPDTSTLWP